MQFHIPQNASTVRYQVIHLQVTRMHACICNMRHLSGSISHIIFFYQLHVLMKNTCKLKAKITLREIIKVFGRHIWFSFQMRNMSHFCIKTATSIIKKLFIFLNTLQGRKA